MAECLKVSPYDIKAYLEEKIAEFHMAVLQKGVEIQLRQRRTCRRCGWTGIRWIILWTISFRALKYTEKGIIYITVRTTKKKWSIEVKDTGIGIPKEEQRNIFHEYYRAQNAMNFQETGSGIGLMITRRIVKQHHGDISFSSTEGKGTIFTVTFPLKIKSGIVVEQKRKYAGNTRC